MKQLTIVKISKHFEGVIKYIKVNVIFSNSIIAEIQLYCNTALLTYEGPLNFLVELSQTDTVAKFKQIVL